jgi:glycosyltransferase involved in cell wall biosynthesis
MRVLQVISSGGMYGAEAVILNLARAMEAGPHSVELAVFENLPHPNFQMHETALKQWIPSQLVRCRGQLDWSAVVRIRQLAAEARAEVVHAHGFKADIYAYLAMRQSGVPLVSTCHSWYDTDRIVRLYGALDRFVLRRYPRVVAVSDEVRRRLLKAGVREQRIRMVRNGIDLRQFAAAEPSLRAEFGAAPIVGLVGRLAWEKGVDLFLRAAAKLLPQFPQARFVVAGEGPDREKLQQLIADLAIGESVAMLGRRDDMAGVYASLDVMVSASRQEGLPIAVLEAMASARAVVATAVGDVPSIVLDGKTGVLVPAGDVDALTAAIAGLLRDPERRARLGAAAREMVRDQYSAERMAAEYLKVYNEAIAATPAVAE